MTEGLDRGCRLLHHLIRIDHTDLCARLVTLTNAADDRLEAVIADTFVIVVRCDMGTNKANIPQIIKGATDFVISGFRGVIIGETGHLIQWRDGATVIRGHTEMRVADEEGKMEPRPNLRGHHGGITWFGLCVVRVGFPLTLLGFHLLSDRGSRKVHATVDLDMILAVEVVALADLDPILASLRMAVDAVSANGRGVTVTAILRAYATLFSSQRRGNTGRHSIGREEVVDDVFDEDPLALSFISNCIVKTRT